MRVDDPNESGFDREPVTEDSRPFGCKLLLGLLFAGGAFWYLVCKIVYAWWHR